MVSGRRSSTIVAVRQYRDRDSASSTAKKAGNEADQQSTELLDKANAYVDDLKVLVCLMWEATITIVWKSFIRRHQLAVAADFQLCSCCCLASSHHLMYAM